MNKRKTKTERLKALQSKLDKERNKIQKVKCLLESLRITEHTDETMAAVIILGGNFR